MSIDDFLSGLEKVRSVRNGKWIACCPAHLDHSPSLSIKVCEDRILIHCFAGCSVEAICQALGIHFQELFFNSLPPRDLERMKRERARKENEIRDKRTQEGRLIDAWREAEKLITTCQGYNVSSLEDSKINRLMDSVSLAWEFLRNEDQEKFYELSG